MHTATSDDDPLHALDGFAQRLRQAERAAMAAATSATSSATTSAALSAAMLSARTAAAPAAAPAAPLPTATAVSTPAAGRDDIGQFPHAVRQGGRGGWLNEPVDVSDIEFRLSATAPATPAAADDDAMRTLSQRVAADWATDASAAAEPAWQPDARALLRLPRRNPRVLDTWHAGAWVGVARRVADDSTELSVGTGGPIVEAFGPQVLLLLWPPAQLDAPRF